MAQSVEQFTRNEQVISSNLITSSKKYGRSISTIFFYPKRSGAKVRAHSLLFDDMRALRDTEDKIFIFYPTFYKIYFFIQS